jgi:hypothetical protein
VIVQPVMLASAEIAVKQTDPWDMLLQEERYSVGVGYAASLAESSVVLQDTVFHWVQAVVCWMVV